MTTTITADIIARRFFIESAREVRGVKRPIGLAVRMRPGFEPSLFGSVEKGT